MENKLSSSYRIRYPYHTTFVNPIIPLSSNPIFVNQLGINQFPHFPTFPFFPIFPHFPRFPAVPLRFILPLHPDKNPPFFGLFQRICYLCEKLIHQPRTHRQPNYEKFIESQALGGNYNHPVHRMFVFAIGCAKWRGCQVFKRKSLFCSPKRQERHAQTGDQE